MNDGIDRDASSCQLVEKLDVVLAAGRIDPARVCLEEVLGDVKLSATRDEHRSPTGR